MFPSGAYLTCLRNTSATTPLNILKGQVRGKAAYLVDRPLVVVVLARACENLTGGNIPQPNHGLICACRFGLECVLLSRWMVCASVTKKAYPQGCNLLRGEDELNGYYNDPEHITK
jgi:hypothetical protein